MSDNEPDDRELRKLDREYDHQEKRLEAANDMMKEAPGLLGELVQEVFIPLMTTAQSQQQQMWEPPEEQRDQPEYEPQVGGVSQEDADQVRDSLNLENGKSE